MKNFQESSLKEMDYTQRFMDRVESSTDQALALGDLKTAIKLNWLKNAVRFDGLSLDDAAFQYMAVSVLGKFGNLLAHEEETKRNDAIVEATKIKVNKERARDRMFLSKLAYDTKWGYLIS